MWFFPLTAAINAITSLLLGLFVYFKNRKSILNKTFAFFSFSVAFWSLSYFFWQIAIEKESALFWTRALIAGAIFIPIFYFHFVTILLNVSEKNKKIIFTGYSLSILFFILNFTPFFVKSVEVKLIFQFWPEPGIFFHPFLLTFFGLAFYSWLLLFRALKKLFGIQKEQVKYVFIGTLLGFLGGSTNYFLWYNIPIYPYGNFLVALYVCFVAYAILKYRLMDIRFVLGRGMVYGLSLSIIIGLAFLLMSLGEMFLESVPFNIMASAILVFSVIVFQPIFKFFEKLASRYFYYTFYSYQKVLTDLGKGLIRHLDLDKLSLLIVTTLMETMNLERTVVLIKEQDKGEYRIQKNIGFKEENGISLVKDNFLTFWLEKTQKPLVYEELSLMIRDIADKKEKEKMEKLKENMKRIEAALCLPLLMEEKIIGMIVLGNKVSNDSYSEQDIELLSSLANQASIALQNAKLYSEVKGFGKKLEKEVGQATRELKKAYDELKNLDKAKTEFVLMTSHQLRTPLSIIKGYLSMMIDGSYGRVPTKLKGKLANTFESSQRLIRIVNDLLDISKIEMGRMELEKENVKTEELIKSCYEEMNPEVKKKRLKLIWQKPKSALPEVEIDYSKIRQVILNLIDNALKYTNKGSIEIEAKKMGSLIQISIKDTGEGMDKEEEKNVFEIFTRGAAGKNYWIQGSGLGLYTAKKYLELHKGKIWAESKGRGKGSTFFVELPAK